MKDVRENHPATYDNLQRLMNENEKVTFSKILTVRKDDSDPAQIRNRKIIKLKVGLEEEFSQWFI